MTTGCKQRKKLRIKKISILVEQFADIKILRYQVPGFEDLSVDQRN
jgi:riboflavin synthase